MGGVIKRISDFIIADGYVGEVYSSSISKYGGLLLADSFATPLICKKSEIDEFASTYSDPEYYDYYYSFVDAKAIEGVPVALGNIDKDYFINHAIWNISNTVCAELATKTTIDLDIDIIETLSEYFRKGVQPVIEGVSDDQKNDSAPMDLNSMKGDSTYSECHIFGVSKDGLMLKELSILLFHDGKLYQKKSGPFDYSYDPFEYSGFSEYNEAVLYGYEIPMDVQAVLREEIGFVD
jgi:hypothetical protein